MFAIGRPVSEDLRPEVPHIQPEDVALPHCSIPARRGPYPAFAADVDATEPCQPPAEVGVLTVKLDRAIETVDSRERLTPDREVAAVEYGANLKCVVHEEVCRRRHEQVVQPGGAHARFCPSRRTGTVPSRRPARPIGRTSARGARARKSARDNPRPCRPAHRPSPGAAQPHAPGPVPSPARPPPARRGRHAPRQRCHRCWRC